MENKHRIREIRERIRDENGKKLSGTAVANILGITPQYYYEIERGEKNLSAEMAARIADIFGVTTDYLLGRTDDPDQIVEHEQSVSKLPALTEKDERDIQKELEKIIKGLKTGSGFAAFGGVDIDELDEEDRELLIASLENSLRLAKRIAKQKFTPKKYRKN